MRVTITAPCIYYQLSRLSSVSYYQQRRNFGFKLQLIEAITMGIYGGGRYLKYEDLLFHRQCLDNYSNKTNKVENRFYLFLRPPYWVDSNCSYNYNCGLVQPTIVYFLFFIYALDIAK